MQLFASHLFLSPALLQAFKAEEAAKKARELVRRKSVLTKSTLPGKLADCSAGFEVSSEAAVGHVHDCPFKALPRVRAVCPKAPPSWDPPLPFRLVCRAA